MPMTSLGEPYKKLSQKVDLDLSRKYSAWKVFRLFGHPHGGWDRDMGVVVGGLHTYIPNLTELRTHYAVVGVGGCLNLF